VSSPRIGSGRRPSWGWQDKGRCRGASLWLFFGGGRAEREPERDERELYVKRTYCWPCPVRARCLDHALEYREAGIWGGMNDDERSRERRRRARLARMAAEHELAKPERAEVS
jgi:WhiB family redox-sensing transcriptional regulator